MASDKDCIHVGMGAPGSAYSGSRRADSSGRVRRKDVGGVVGVAETGSRQSRRSSHSARSHSLAPSIPGPSRSTCPVTSSLLRDPRFMRLNPRRSRTPTGAPFSCRGTQEHLVCQPIFLRTVRPLSRSLSPSRPVVASVATCSMRISRPPADQPGVAVRQRDRDRSGLQQERAGAPA